MDEFHVFLKQLFNKNHVVLAIDGLCGAGKSTLANLLKQHYHCQVIHLDDYFLPMRFKNSNEMEPTLPNIDVQRFMQQILLPLSRKQSIKVQPFDCHQQTLLTSINVPYQPFTIIEGSYSLHPMFTSFYTAQIYLTCNTDIQIQRLKRRDADSLSAFLNKWIPMELYYQQQFHIMKQCDFILDTSEGLPSMLF